MSTPNFEIEDKQGRKFWISRSIVVIPFTFKYVGDDLYTLIEKRGKSVSSTGKWCCPCGYLDFDETLAQACVREVREETGVNIDIKNVHFINFNSDPTEARQNVGMRFVCFASPDAELDMSKIETKDEVDDLRWIKVGTFGFLHPLKNKAMNYSQGYDFLKIDKDFQNERLGWAFDHNYLILHVLAEFYTKQYGIQIINEQ